MNHLTINNELLSGCQLSQDSALFRDALWVTDNFVNKNFLINLDKNPIVLLGDEYKKTDQMRIYKINKLVMDKNENINNLLTSVFASLHSINSTIILIIDSKESQLSFYLGVRSADTSAGEILTKSMQGNFQGSDLSSSLRNRDINELFSAFSESSTHVALKNVSCVTVVPSLRDNNNDGGFVQGIEKLIETMRNEDYTAIFIASPVPKSKLEERKRGYEGLYTTLSPYQKQTLAVGDNSSVAVARGISRSFSDSINESISLTSGDSFTMSTSVTEGSGYSSGTSGEGINTSSNSSRSTTRGTSQTSNYSKTRTDGTSKATTDGANLTSTTTEGTSQTLTVEKHNKTVLEILSKIDKQLERIRECEAFGVWECAAYFLAEDMQSSYIASNTYKALVTGDHSNVENAFVNIWNNRENQMETGAVLEYLKYGFHPIIELPAYGDFISQATSPTNYISGKELPLFMGLPQKSVPGLTVLKVTDFGRNIHVGRLHQSIPQKDERSIHIGKIYHRGTVENTRVDLNMDSLTSHCFITGSTGSGKSNTTYCMIEQLIKNKIPFLVIEPAKGEYRKVFGNLKDINIFTTNSRLNRFLKLNPFKFNPEIHVLEHLDRLIEIFNASWEMTAAMPAILKQAVERTYILKNWDLLNSMYLGTGAPEYPTFSDLLRELPKVIQESDYSTEVKGNYSGALVTRVTSMTNGIIGQIFCSNYEIPDEVLFDQNTIIDLSRIGAVETKSLLMGILIMKLNEYRISTTQGSNARLRHITILEEAHNLLKKCSEAQSMEGSNLQGKSVEMLCNSIAEMRTYGEGFLIVDQSPSAVSATAIKNTNTKIIMRLPDKEDGELAGASVGLNTAQIAEIPKLGTGVAIVMQNNWLEAVQIQVNACSKAYETNDALVDEEMHKNLRGEFLHSLLLWHKGSCFNAKAKALEILENSTLPQDKKKDFLAITTPVLNEIEQYGKIVREDAFIDTVIQITGTGNLLDVHEEDLHAIESSDVMDEHIKLNVKPKLESLIKRWKAKILISMRAYVSCDEAMTSELLIWLIVAKIQKGKVQDLKYYRYLVAWNILHKN